MKCDICEKDGVEVTLVDKLFGKGDDAFIIRNVPVYSCPHCGESYLTADTMYELERLKLHHDVLIEQKCIGVIDFVPAARESVAAGA
jgi:YgiT-type zinc finger domain-containing protein